MKLKWKSNISNQFTPDNSVEKAIDKQLFNETKDLLYSIQQREEGRNMSVLSIDVDISDNYAISRVIRALSAILYSPKPTEVKKKKKKLSK